MSALISGASTQLYFLTLDNETIRLKSFEGAGIRGEVETVDTGPQQVLHKHIARVRYESFTITVGLSMGTTLAGWIKSSLARTPERKSGSLITTTVDGEIQDSCHFTEALIEEITIPAMDASSNDQAFFTIRFQPETLSYGKSDHAVVMPRAEGRQGQWRCANFRLRVGTLPCQRVVKVDRLTIRQGLVESGLGQLRQANAMEPVNLQFPNLRITLAATDIAAWQEWFAAFVIRGENDQASEIPGTLEFLDPSLREVLGSVEFSHTGIFSLAPQKPETGHDASVRYVAELYVEEMTIKLPAL